MNAHEQQEKIRSFLRDDLMKEEAEFLSLEDTLELDSLDQTELRVFLAQEFKIDTDAEKVPMESLLSLKGILALLPAAA